MIGLFGIYRASPGAPAELAPMAERLAIPLVVDAPAGRGAALGHACHGHGPACSVAEGDGARAVAIGELFNLAELAPPGDGPPPKTLAELLLRLVRGGEVERLAGANGLFAGAVYERNGHRLTLVTDRLASYPLHLWREGGEIAFAGQLYVLLGERRIARKADPAALAQLFTMQRTVGRTTPIAGVEALPAACIWQVDREGVRERRYWRLAWRTPDFRLRDGARRLAAALRRALERQTTGTRAGLLLSGGIDSRLVLASAPRGRLSCWTTAGYDDNPELAVARRIAAVFEAPHRALLVRPEDTLEVLERTVVESNGMYPASTPMSAFLSTVGAECETILSGHGIDYTLRGYYLPARFLELCGTRTRWPALRPVPRRPTGEDVLANLRQGPPRRTIERIVRRERAEFWWRSQADALSESLAPWLEEGDPYNAWDAFILHAVSKHYAFTAMMAVRAVGNLRLPAFDAEVFDLYLSMPPAWRCSGRMAQLALAELSPTAARLPNANTLFRADLAPQLETLGLIARGALRRLGVLARPRTPTPMHSTGSWQDVAALYREDPGHRRRFAEIRGRLDALCFGLLDAGGLAACIDEHLDGRAKHTKLLRQLLTHDAWVRCFGIDGVG